MVMVLNLTGYGMVNCIAHTLQLAINDILDDNSKVQLLLKKCRSIVGHFKRSNIDKAKLTETQTRVGTAQHKLIQDVATRWNLCVNITISNINICFMQSSV